MAVLFGALAVGAVSPNAQSTPLHAQRARSVPLARVRLTGGPPKQAQDVTVKYRRSLALPRRVSAPTLHYKRNRR